MSGNDLDVLIPGRDVTCKGEIVRVLPVAFGRYPKAIQLLRPIATALQASGIFHLSVDKGEDGKPTASFKMEEDWLAVIPKLLEDCGEPLMQFFAFAINQPRHWLDSLDADEGLALAVAIFGENADFLVRRILPMLTTMGFVKASEVPAGEQLSQSSTASDIPGTASS